MERPVGKSQNKEPETPLPPVSPVAAGPKGCVITAIHHAKPDSVTNLIAEAISIATAVSPLWGEANAELCLLVSVQGIRTREE